MHPYAHVHAFLGGADSGWSHIEGGGQNFGFSGEYKNGNHFLCLISDVQRKENKRERENAGKWKRE